MDVRGEVKKVVTDFLMKTFLSTQGRFLMNQMFYYGKITKVHCHINLKLFIQKKKKIGILKSV